MSKSDKAANSGTRVAHREPSWALWMTRTGVVLSVLLLTLEYGLRVNLQERAWINVAERLVFPLFICEYFFSIALSRQRWASLRSRWLETVVIIGLVAVLSLEALVGGDFWGACGVIAIRIYMVVRLVRYAVAGSEGLLGRKMRAVWLAVFSFVALILIGAVLLMMPAMHTETSSAWTFSDAFFTSTSAACVTGLGVNDIGTDLSSRGQLLLLVLIQLGGLGPISCAMFLSYLGRKRMDVRQTQALREMLGATSSGELGRLLGFVLLSTFVCELLGAVALFAGCPLELSGGDRAWWAAFHSVSAFNNAGFALQADSICPFAANPAVCLPIMALVVLGGLGFPVIRELVALRPASLFFVRRLYARWGTPVTVTPPRLSLHAKIVLLVTVLLLGLGTAAIYMFEYGQPSMAQYSTDEQWLISAFHSTIARTAGFNSVDVLALNRGTIMTIFFLMVVGAAPMSTGGGIRVMSVAVIWQTFRAMGRNEEKVTAFSRTIPRSAIQNAMAVIAAYVVTLFVVSAALTLTHQDLKYGVALFESTSALSTVGLSAGVTGETNVWGRLILCVAMFMGRIGPIALLLAMVSKARSATYSYPEENVMV